MRKHTALLVFYVFTVFRVDAKTPPVSQYLFRFSPLGFIIARNLGLEDRNGNGVIDKGAGEGYEEFVAKYGNADIGFYINGITQGVNNGRLEEPEIVNHYYTNIRFKQEFGRETAAIESEVKTYMYANKVPLVWLDDEQGTVMKLVNRILGGGWQNKQVTLSEAEKLFTRVMDKLDVRPLPVTPDASGNGLSKLPNFITFRKGYCFEVAQFGFWFFSQLKIESIDMEAALKPNYLHGVIKIIANNKLIDYFGVSNGYGISANQWAVHNPLQCLSDYYLIQGVTGKTDNITGYYEQAVVYNKYDITSVSFLMEKYADGNIPNHKEIITLGEFILNNTDMQSVLNSNYLNKAMVKNNLGSLLVVLLESYSAVKNRRGFDNMASLLNQHYRDIPDIQQHIDKFQFR